MKLDHREKEFRRVKSKSGGSLFDLFEAERLDLYDYLLRMTGQVSRSDDTVDEVFQAFTEEMLESITSYQELRVSLYVTARKFNADIWGDDTSKLANQSLESLDGSEKTEGWQKFGETDVRLRSLPSKQREVLLLRERCHFSQGEISEITGMTESLVGEQLGLAIKIIPNLELVKMMPHHPLPEKSRLETQNLSIVMRGIKTKPVGVWSPGKLIFIFLILILSVVWFLYGEAILSRLNKKDALPPLPHAPRPGAVP